MDYLIFILGFTLIHMAAYTLAGALTLKISKEVYEGKNRLMIYLRDMSDEQERGHLQTMFLPGQYRRLCVHEGALLQQNRLPEIPGRNAALQRCVCRLRRMAAVLTR